ILYWSTDITYGRWCVFLVRDLYCCCRTMVLHATQIGAIVYPYMGYTVDLEYVY
ncbi:1825_t:CDS:1, partial [Racocetra persica]